MAAYEIEQSVLQKEKKSAITMKNILENGKTYLPSYSWQGSYLELNMELFVFSLLD